jgi:hypothetical protein
MITGGLIIPKQGWKNRSGIEQALTLIVKGDQKNSQKDIWIFS